MNKKLLGVGALALAVALTSASVSGTYAKYISESKASDSARIAKWNIDFSKNTTFKESIDLFKDSFTDTGSINIDGSTIHCWKHGGHGTQTYLEVVENSCNLGVNTRTHIKNREF